ncbi:MAG: DUF934 domain-containing protein [Terricaulis sp.]
MRIIRDRHIVEDEWELLTPESAPPLPARGKLIVPLTLWQALRDDLHVRRDPIGVWLNPTDKPEALANDISTLSLIAVNFPKFTDGRGYSVAQALRTRLHFRGELRAIGDVQRDQLFYMQRVGFNSFVLRSDEQLDTALGAFRDFSTSYQASVDQPLPHYLRRAQLAEMAA